MPLHRRMRLCGVGRLVSIPSDPRRGKLAMEFNRQFACPAKRLFIPMGCERCPARP